jgi:hypothetical protein
MKKTILLLSLVAVFTTVGAVRSLADYTHDSHGWYDEHHHRHAFIMHNHHRGYWDNHNGTKVFITI